MCYFRETVAFCHFTLFKCENNVFAIDKGVVIVCARHSLVKCLVKGAESYQLLRTTCMPSPTQNPSQMTIKLGDRKRHFLSQSQNRFLSFFPSLSRPINNPGISPSLSLFPISLQGTKMGRGRQNGQKYALFYQSKNLSITPNMSINISPFNFDTFFLMRVLMLPRLLQ